MSTSTGAALRTRGKHPADRLPKGSPTPEPAWATIAEGAEHAHCSTKTIRRLIAAGHLPGYRLGPRAIRIDLNELDALLRPIPSAKVG